jgi:hypothetical protein
MRFQAMLAWVIHRLSAFRIAVVCFGKSSRMDFFVSAAGWAHAYTPQHLGLQQRQAVETALWEALRALEESASLYRRMAGRAATSHHEFPARLYQERAFEPNHQEFCGTSYCGST